MIQELNGTELLISTVILSVGSLLFMILLLLTYFTREKEENIRTKLYSYILVTTLILVLSEFIEIIAITFSGQEPWLTLSFKLHWGMGFIVFSAAYYYNIVFMDNIETNSIKDVINHSVHTKIMTIVHIVFTIVFIILPFDFSKVTKSSMTFFPGPAALWMYFYCAFVEIIVFIHLLRKNKKMPKRIRIALWLLMGLLIASFGIQILAPTIAILVIGAVLQTYFLYFTIENPDLIMIEELEKAKDNIDKSNRAKTDFLANMSFEIKKPMREIVQYSKALNNNEFNKEEVNANLRKIVTSGNNLLYTVNNILDISRIESGDEVLELKEYSIKSIVMEIISIIDPKVYNKPVKFNVEVDESLPDKLYGDGTKLFQVLMNIIMNSVEHTEVGMIKLQVNGNILDNKLQLHIKISDTGEGMKKEDYDQLLEMLSKLDKEFYSDIGGTGLGLAVCKKYLDLMNGTMKIESEYKAGTITYVDITQKIVNPSPMGNIYYASGENKKHTYRDCSGHKILIVDDNKANLVATEMILAKYNFEIETLDNAKDCIYKIKAEEKYDMILMDHMMPEIDGIEAVHILRSLEGYDLPPIIILTANVITGMKEAYIKEGFDDYLAKPINIPELEKLLNKYIK